MTLTARNQKTADKLTRLEEIPTTADNQIIQVKPYEAVGSNQSREVAYLQATPSKDKLEHLESKYSSPTQDIMAARPIGKGKQRPYSPSMGSSIPSKMGRIKHGNLPRLSP